MDTDRLKSRVRGRECAKSILDLIDVDIKQNRQSVLAFLDELKCQLLVEDVQQELKEKSKRLSELAATVLEFGHHKGTCLSEIPRDYLDWLYGSAESTVADVGEYLRLTESMDCEGE